MLRRLLLTSLVALVSVFATGSVAGAHVELDPGEAVAGSILTLTFSFHHGKDGTATTALEVQLPEGAELVELPAVPGWSATSDPAAGTIAWSGGSVPDGTEAAFPAVVRLPAEPGVALFKAIQTTEAGELAWIEEEASEGEGAHPAPRLTLLADPDATTTTAVPTTTTESASPSTTERRPGTSLEAEERDDGSTSAAPWVIGSGVAALAAVVGGGLLLKRRVS